MKIIAQLCWSKIDTVLLDMDGTLLDKYFDDYFWEHYVPTQYGRQHELSLEDARSFLLARYRQVEQTLAWTDLDYWSQALGLDIPALKVEVQHLIALHPHVLPFLKDCRAQGKQLFLVTNAHPKTLSLKLSQAPLMPYFARFITSAELGVAKEESVFWEKLQTGLGYQPNRTILIDDTEAVLETAARSGLQQVVQVARPSSRQPSHYSNRFPAIDYFDELMPVI